MKRERIIAEVETEEEARKVEETVKTGYVEPIIETIVNWIGVEEDLHSTYERLAEKPDSGSRRAVFQRLAGESKANMTALADLKRSFETLDTARIERINLLAGEKSKGIRGG
jgi:hypothetical protein